jgi:hypothetical protein
MEKDFVLFPQFFAGALLFPAAPSLALSIFPDTPPLI